MFLSKIYPLLHINVSYETFTPLASRQDEMFYIDRNKLNTRRALSFLLSSLLYTYLSFAQLACNIAKWHCTAARALMCAFRGKAI